MTTEIADNTKEARSTPCAGSEPNYDGASARSARLVPVGADGARSDSRETLSVLSGDCREVLKTLPSESVQCCVTSPPYWGLRDYGHTEQIGQEATAQGYVEAMVAVFAEVRRVLRSDGTLWLNLGDSYAGSANNGGAKGKLQGTQNATGKSLLVKRGDGIKPKDLIGIPWRVALALQEAGWWLRCDIIWHKLNPMPESVTDRPTRAHEYVFLLTKSERYYYDAAAIQEPTAYPVPAERNASGDYSAGSGRNDGGQHRSGGFVTGDTRNKRSVWSVASAPYPGSHFAVFPGALISPCILAGTKAGDLVLDPFGGSGTTGATAICLGRRAVLIELNPEYAKLIEERTTTTMGLPL